MKEESIAGTKINTSSLQGSCAYQVNLSSYIDIEFLLEEIWWRDMSLQDHDSKVVMSNSNENVLGWKFIWKFIFCSTLLVINSANGSKNNKREYTKLESGIKQVCVFSPTLFQFYSEALHRELEIQSWVIISG